MSTTTTTTAARTGQLALVLLLALLVVLTTMAPALAAPPSAPDGLTLPHAGPDPDPDGPGDLVAPEEGDDPEPDPDVTGPDDLTATPVDPDPTGPGDLKQPEADPHPTPSLTLTPRCDPDGFAFSLNAKGLPQGTTLLLQWREVPGGAITTIPTTLAGFVPSGEGDFQARAVVLLNGRPILRTGWTDVTVDCEDPEPTVTIDVSPHCEPDAGLSYAIEVDSPPEGNIAFKAQWRGEDGQIHTVDGQSGTIATGEGVFEIRGVLHYQGPGFYATEFTEVVITCDDGEPVDPPLTGTPNFTG